MLANLSDPDSKKLFEWWEHLPECERLGVIVSEYIKRDMIDVAPVDPAPKEKPQETFPCPSCSRILRSREGLTLHRKSSHPENKNESVISNEQADFPAVPKARK